MLPAMVGGYKLSFVLLCFLIRILLFLLDYLSTNTGPKGGAADVHGLQQRGVVRVADALLQPPALQPDMRAVQCEPAGVRGQVQEPEGGVSLIAVTCAARQRSSRRPCLGGRAGAGQEAA